MIWLYDRYLPTCTSVLLFVCLSNFHVLDPFLPSLQCLRAVVSGWIACSCRRYFWKLVSKQSRKRHWIALPSGEFSGTVSGTVLFDESVSTTSFDFFVFSPTDRDPSSAVCTSGLETFNFLVFLIDSASFVSASVVRFSSTVVLFFLRLVFLASCVLFKNSTGRFDGVASEENG